MYNFIDTTTASGNALLPSEAMKINGEYIEDLISGYRTLRVQGREALSPDVESFETGIRDGSKLKKKRYPERIITVTYQLSAKTDQKFREAYNKLAQVLNVEEAQLIFADEQDKYFTGTPCTIGSVEPGKNSVVGKFEILCCDPFKYSVEQYEVDTVDNEGLMFSVDYNGTYKAFPELEATIYSESETDGETITELTGNGDCGYVAFINSNEKIIQIGSPDEEDGETAFPKAQTLIHQYFDKETSWGSAAQSLWNLNAGVVSDPSTMTQTGSMGLAQPAPTTYPNSRYLRAASYGTGEGKHGPTISRAIPADASGEVGAKNFSFSYKQKMCTANGETGARQYGAFQVLLTDASGMVVAGVSILKNRSGKDASLSFHVNGKTQETITIDLSANNKYFGNNTYKNGVIVQQTVKTCNIKKSGGTIKFNIGGIVRSYTDSAVSDAAVTKITFSFFQYNSTYTLSYNGIYWAKFVKQKCNTWREVPNKLSCGDVVVADCKNGEIYLNDAEEPNLGALGNDWEEFYLAPGTNIIGVAYSDWLESEYAPTFKMRYREVFL